MYEGTNFSPALGTCTVGLVCPTQEWQAKPERSPADWVMVAEHLSLELDATAAVDDDALLNSKYIFL